ncbi:hypothetical protein K461DRAFT_297929 [Myriangium duriaei CBS 260.36]|uniref:Uncharacterized protein n=1 Tax=Myriangium duriaei CBS 260.36 TaxID=1168546 RepID=A0A9P4IXF2_9PEZI|nr:hypothetical protein K461DRAFT_297929 [Myriangium duriaei CBS 260.36]
MAVGLGVLAGADDLVGRAVGQKLRRSHGDEIGQDKDIVVTLVKKDALLTVLFVDASTFVIVVKPEAQASSIYGDMGSTGSDDYCPGKVAHSGVPKPSWSRDGPEFFRPPPPVPGPKPPRGPPRIPRTDQDRLSDHWTQGTTKFVETFEKSRPVFGSEEAFMMPYLRLGFPIWCKERLDQYGFFDIYTPGIYSPRIATSRMQSLLTWISVLVDEDVGKFVALEEGKGTRKNHPYELAMARRGDEIWDSCRRRRGRSGEMGIQARPAAPPPPSLPQHIFFSD